MEAFFAADDERMELAATVHGSLARHAPIGAIVRQQELRNKFKGALEEGRGPLLFHGASEWHDVNSYGGC